MSSSNNNKSRAAPKKKNNNNNENPPEQQQEPSAADATVAAASAVTNNTNIPVVCRDPRYMVGREMIGQHESVEIFGVLLEQTRGKYGDDHFETVPAYYEYGNAIFRHSVRQNQVQQQQEEATKDNVGGGSNAREAAAAAAEQRAKQAAATADAPAKSISDDDDKKPAAAAAAAVAKTKEVSASTNSDDEKDKKNDQDHNTSSKKDTNNDDDDIQLALEMMETSWSILDKHHNHNQEQQEPLLLYPEWVEEQLSRILTGIGDVLSFQQKHADSVDAYLRALQYRQVQLQKYLDTVKDDASLQLKLLEIRRKIVESNILIVEELLSCPLKGQDIVTTETKVVLVPAGKTEEYATFYYNKAREELQETCLLLGQLASSQSVDKIGPEKENICFAATMVMHAGETLAAIPTDDNEKKNSEPPAKKKAKKK